MNDDLIAKYPYPLEEVPQWCRMHPKDHQDGMGGCWSISYGFVRRDGEQNCLGCDYHERNAH